MEKNLVFTIAMGEIYSKISELTRPSLELYAERIGADFLCLTEQQISNTTPHWEKFNIFSLLNKYKRIIYLDSDILVRKDCPNLFDIVPEECLGMFNEAPFTDRSKELLIDVCKQYSILLPKWNGKYYNSGVMVISRRHKYLFKKPEKEVTNFYEQSYLNMVIANSGVEMFELPYKFNRMTCMDIVTGEERFASYIIHYAGYPSLEFVLSIIRKDKEKLENDYPNYEYKQHIYISVNGGLGDQVCAEPAIRFLINNVYKGDDVVVATHWPELFQHLNIPVIEHGKFNPIGDVPYYVISSLPGPDTVHWSVVSNLLCHTVDFCSMALLRRTLPLDDKQIKLTYTVQDLSNLISVVGIKNLNELIVVHPGSHWESKTFPVEWWQEVVDKLAETATVCLIGKSEEDKQDKNLRGTVPIQVSGNIIDTRDLLDIGSLKALLASAKILLSNDSSPVHIAGAFDNWIVLIPTCKHPDHILPYRKRSLDYKTLALYKRLVNEDVSSKPTEVHGTVVDKIIRGWDEYLPEASNVVNEILRIYNEE